MVGLVDVIGPFSYMSSQTPVGYCCEACGKSGIKLWRYHNRFLVFQNLKCAKCSAVEDEVELIDLDNEGKVFSPSSGLKTNCITDYRVPAVPWEDGSTLWGYSSIPQDGYNWWCNLPNE